MDEINVKTVLFAKSFSSCEEAAVYLFIGVSKEKSDELLLIFSIINEDKSHNALNVQDMLTIPLVSAPDYFEKGISGLLIGDEVFSAHLEVSKDFHMRIIMTAANNFGKVAKETYEIDPDFTIIPF